MALERGCNTSNASVQGDTAGASSNRRADWIPPARRDCVVVGGFPLDTEKDVIVAALRGFVSPNAVKKWDGVGAKDVVSKQFSTSGEIIFENSGHMWRFLKACKGTRFHHEGRKLFHSVDKTVEEQQLSRRVSRVVRVVTEKFSEKGLLGEEKIHLLRKCG